MGIDASFAELLVGARAEGADFGRTVTIGRLSLYVPREELERLAGLLGLGKDEIDKAGGDRYCETFLSRFLGAQSVDSIDHSSYQGASHAHDLNQPLPERLRGAFDALIDGGSMEHIFDVRQVLENYMRLIKVGGRLFVSVPANNLFGHGVCQFSPELFYRVFSESNGFAVRDMIVTESPFTSVEASRRWRSYRTVDPATVGKRVRLVNNKPLMVSVYAEKVAEVRPFESSPQQSDYSARWQASQQEPAMEVARGQAQEPPVRPFAYHSFWKEVKRRLRQSRKHSLANRLFFKPIRQ